MTASFEPIGFVRHDAAEVPRHWTVSEVEGRLVIEERYRRGIEDIRPGQRVVVLFHFDRSADFTPDLVEQTPPHRDRPMGVFSICSPRRPNALGLSVVEVLGRRGRELRVRGLDMLDGTPILDIKPHIEVPKDCPSSTDFRKGGW